MDSEKEIKFLNSVNGYISDFLLSRINDPCHTYDPADEVLNVVGEKINDRIKGLHKNKDNKPESTVTVNMTDYAQGAEDAISVIISKLKSVK